MIFEYPQEEETNLETPLLEKEKVKFQLKVDSLEIKKGDLVAVIGKVGSGKTTLLKGIMGEIDYSGNYEY